MTYCYDWKELLLLDAYGELDPEERAAWEKHLETCSGCSQERKRLLQLLEDVKEAMPDTSLSHENANALHRAITGKLRAGRNDNWLGKPFLGRHIRHIHALAAACLLIVAIGWYGLRGFQRPPFVQTVSDTEVEEQMIAKNFDFLENMELLEEMDVLEKMGQVMDQGE